MTEGKPKELQRQLARGGKRRPRFRVRLRAMVGVALSLRLSETEQAENLSLWNPKEWTHHTAPCVDSWA